MKSIQFNSNFGHFKTRLSGQFSDDTLDIVGQGFLADMLYRICGSGADKSLGVNVKRKEKDDEGKEVELEPLWKKRSEVPYNATNKAVIETSVADKITELLEDKDDGDDYHDMALEFVVLGEHSFGESSTPMQRASTLVAAFLDRPMQKADESEEAFAVRFEAAEEMESGYRGLFELQGLKNAKTAMRDALVSFAHSKGLGVQPPKTKK